MMCGIVSNSEYLMQFLFASTKATQSGYQYPLIQLHVSVSISRRSIFFSMTTNSASICLVLSITESSFKVLVLPNQESKHG